jgi:hypothetical protein
VNSQSQNQKKTSGFTSDTKVQIQRKLPLSPWKARLANEIEALSSTIFTGDVLSALWLDWSASYIEERVHGIRSFCCARAQNL